MMKKLNLVVLITCLGLFAVGCEKDTLEGNAPLSTDTGVNFQGMQLNIQDGILHFTDNESYQNGLSFFNNLTPQERINWSSVNNFETLQIIDDKIRKAEKEFDEIYYQGIDPNSTEQELIALGKPVEFSNTYKNALEKNIIIQSQDQEYGGYQFELSIHDKTIGLVANENGLVQINGTLYQFTTTLIKSMLYTSSNDISSILAATSSTSTITVRDVNDDREYGCNEFINGDIFDQEGVIWYYESPKHKFKHFVYFKSCHNDYSINTNYYTEAIAYKKKWWKWDYRNDYMPITSISGDWSYYWRKYNTATGLNTYEWNNLLVSNTTSPFNYIPASPTNHLKIWLNPNGYRTPPLGGPWVVYSEVNIFEYLIHGSFVGYEGDYYTTNYHY